MSDDELKNHAASLWHRKRPNHATLAEVFSGAWYQACFALHRRAFLSGYKYAVRQLTKKNRRTRK